MAEKETIGFVGLGIMGKPMCKHLLNTGYKLVVHDVNPDPVKQLVGEGAVEAHSPLRPEYIDS